MMQLGTKANANGFLEDTCHDQVKAGDIIIADYRGEAGQRFKVLKDDGRGMFSVQRPDGSVGPMRPSTILAVAQRHIHADDLQYAIKQVRYIHDNDCDFLTIETLRAYGVVDDDTALQALIEEMGEQWCQEGGI